MRFLFNRYAIFCFAFLVIQQAIVASSTLWLVRLSEGIVTGGDIWTNLALFLGSLVLPYFPAAAMSVLLVRWEQRAIGDYLWSYVSRNKSNVFRWLDQGAKQETLAVLNSEALQTISYSIQFYFRLASSSLNVILNIFTISILIDGYFALAYGISFVAGIGLVYLQSARQARLTQLAQEARIGLRKTILSSWDNVLLGNRYNFKQWSGQATASVNAAIAKNGRAAIFQETVSIVIALMTFVPCLIVVWVTVGNNLGNIVALAALAVAMPRLFLILAYTHDLLFLVTQWPVARTRLRRISEVLARHPTHTLELLEQRISWDKLTVCPGDIADSVRSREDILRLTEESRRITIRGDNGSGKSSLLLWLKLRLGDDALYLPPSSELAFESDAEEGSTGQRIRARLLEIMDQAKAKVLLLDEWDANLDSDNQSYISDLIGGMSTQVCVVESRHRT